MTSKLTLSVNDGIISLAKEIANKKGKSVSKMFEEFVVSLSKQETQGESPVDAISKRLRGKNRISIPDNLDYKEFIRNARFEDYLKELKTDD